MPTVHGFVSYWKATRELVNREQAVCTSVCGVVLGSVCIVTRLGDRFHRHNNDDGREATLKHQN